MSRPSPLEQVVSIVQAREEGQTIELHLRMALAELRRRQRSTLAAFGATGFEYSGAADFVLRHGTMRRGQPAPFQGAPKQCYWNALLGSLSRGWAYVEGFAAHPIVYGADGRACPIPHAWNEDDAGNLIDTTWPVHDYADLGAYMGVRFSAARAHEAAWDGNACVLHDNERGFPLFREPWQGEDSPGELRGLLGRVCAAHRAEGGDFARLAVHLERNAIAEGWPSL